MNWRCLFGHKLSVISRCGHSTEHIGCERCGRQWGMNHSVQAFLPWDAEISSFHREMGYREGEAVAAWKAGRRTRPMTNGPTHADYHAGFVANGSRSMARSCAKSNALG